jgi:hypothetical protein
MEIKDIIILLINAALTILTTAIVTRLSLNKGKLEINKELTSRLKTMLVKYSEMVFFGFCILFPLYYLYKFITNPKPIERVEVVITCGSIVNLSIWTLIGMFEVLKFRKERKRTNNQEDTPA